MEQVNSGGLGSIRHRMSHNDALVGLANVQEALQSADPKTYGYRITRTVGDHRYSTHR
jgi:sensor histidine kinase YesM